MANPIKDFFKSKGADLLKAGSEFIDTIVTNKEERDAAKLALAQEVNRHIEEMNAHDLEMEKAYLADVASARALQVAALAQNDLFSKRFIYYLAAFIVVSATCAGFGLYFIKVPEENKRMVEMFFDVYLFAGALSVIYFFFGSSRGQERSEETKAITEATKTAPLK